MLCSIINSLTEKGKAFKRHENAERTCKKEKVQAHYSQRTADHEKVPAESSRKKASGSVFHWYSFSSRAV